MPQLWDIIALLFMNFCMAFHEQMQAQHLASLGIGYTRLLSLPLGDSSFSFSITS